MCAGSFRSQRGMGAAPAFPEGRISNPCSRSEDALIRAYDTAGNVIATHEHAGDSKNGKSPYLPCPIQLERINENKLVRLYN